MIAADFVNKVVVQVINDGKIVRSSNEG